MATVTVILALATGPGFPKGSPEHRYEVQLALGPGGRPDGAAWLADPEPWRVQRFVPADSPRGKVLEQLAKTPLN